MAANEEEAECQQISFVLELVACLKTIISFHAQHKWYNILLTYVKEHLAIFGSLYHTQGKTYTSIRETDMVELPVRQRV
jgi:hypothetical protein